MRHTLFLLFVLISGSLHAQKYQDAYDAGKYEKALKLAEKAIDENSKDLQAFLVKAQCYVALYDNAVTRADYPSGPSSAMTTIQSIQRKDKSGAFQEAHQPEIQSILDAVFRLCETWVTANQLKRANTLLEDLINYQVKAEYYYLWGKVAEGMEDHTTSVQRFNAAAYKIWTDAKTGIKPDPKWDILFADLADAVADDDDFNSAYVIYSRAFRLFNTESISDRCYDLLNNAVSTWLYGYDTAFVMQAVRYIDTLPANIQHKEKFDALKWRGLIYTYKVLSGDYDDANDEYAFQMIKNFACKDEYTGLLDTIESELLANTDILFKASGIQATRDITRLRWYADLHDCVSTDGPATVQALIPYIAEQHIQAKEFNIAAKWIFNFAGSGNDPKITAQLEKKLFDAIIKLPPAELDSVDMFALSIMFPKNLSVKKLQKDESTKLISALIEQKKFSAAGEKLRTQMQIDPKDPATRVLYKQWVVQDFIYNFMPSATAYDMDTWNGSVENCDPGKLPDSIHAKVLQRLNYVRRLAGVPDNCTFNPTFNAKCQEAALMMKANGDLNHGPPPSWKCYTDAGRAGAGNSNLSLGYGGSEALMGQVEDFGANNGSVGHRRWILNPNRKVFGHGSTDYSMALWALGGDDADQSQEIKERYENQFVCWPAQWYFPANLTPGRWSISLRGGDFTDATVEMYIGNRRVELDTVPLEYGYGLPTLVWEPYLGSLDPTKDLTVKVIVRNIGTDARWDEKKEEWVMDYKDFTYEVTLISMY